MASVKVYLVIGLACLMRKEEVVVKIVPVKEATMINGRELQIILLEVHIHMVKEGLLEVTLGILIMATKGIIRKAGLL